MKVGLITIHKIFNYGSALQTFALQSKINAIMGESSCKVIDYKYPDKIHITSSKESFVKTYIKLLFFYVKNFLRSIIYVHRNSYFYSFWKKNYSLTNKCSYKNIKNIAKDFDVLVSGSDQIWNPRFVHEDTSFFLDFAMQNQKCISYASAIGQESISEDKKDLFKNQLSKYTAIGIRDVAVKEELANLLDKKITTVCDPTLLLSDDEWNRIADKSKYKNKSNYILLYILKYSFNPWPDINKLIESVRQKYKLPVLAIYSDTKQNILHHYKSLSRVTVEDFICLIRNASFVITTSFHGTCFSLIYKKNFLSVISDKKKDSRVYDLLKNIGFEQRCISLNQLSSNLTENLIDTSLPVNCDRLNEYISDSFEFLKESLINREEK